MLVDVSRFAVLYAESVRSGRRQEQRRGEQSMPTIKRVEREVERINSSNILPPGVRIERIYDRKDLIDITTRTVLHNMAFGILLIFALQWIFLGNLRSALIVATTIPFALFFAVGILVGAGLLMLPVATQGPGGASFLTAVFTSTSAICVTARADADG